MKILITGGAGYIGSLLTPRLLRLGHDVSVLDGFFYGRGPLRQVEDRLSLVEGDVCDSDTIDRVLERGFDQVIHLAAISNDPSAKLNPDLTRRVNRDAVEDVMRAAKKHGVKRFIYASSASVYGIKDVPDVSEDLTLEPITDYAKFKAEGEAILNELTDDTFTGVSVRAATVCGHAPRLRLDLTINILTMHALTKGRIRVFGGTQMRPNIHVADLVDFYTLLTEADAGLINGEAFNVSYRNESVMGLAEMIRDVLDADVEIDVVPTDDLRSYHLSARKAAEVLGFEPQRPLSTAVEELRAAYEGGEIPEPDSSWYRNVVHMTEYGDSWPFEPDSFEAPSDG